MAAHPILTLPTTSADADELLRLAREFKRVARECYAQNTNLTKGTLDKYPAQLLGLVKTTGVDTVGDVLKLSAEEITALLNNGQLAFATGSSYLNALVALLKACDIPAPPGFAEIKMANIGLGKTKMDMMKGYRGDDVIPTDFDTKVAAYLAKNPGTRESVIIALLALSPTPRGHMYEATLIARGQEEYDRLTEANTSPVIGVLSETDYRFKYVAGNRDVASSAKVAGIRAETKYNPEVVAHLSKYIKPEQKYLFPPIKGKTAYVSTKTFNETWVPKAFAAADLPGLGIQTLRRIAETRIRSDPSKTVAEKEAFAHQMNHSRGTAELYVVVPKGATPDEQRVISEAGEKISQLWMHMTASKDPADKEWINAHLGKMLAALRGPPMPSANLLAKSKKPSVPEPTVYVNRAPRTARKPIGTSASAAGPSGSGGHGGSGVVKGTIAKTPVAQLKPPVAQPKPPVRAKPKAFAYDKVTLKF